MLRLSGFELYSRWVPLKCNCRYNITTVSSVSVRPVQNKTTVSKTKKAGNREQKSRNALSDLWSLNWEVCKIWITRANYYYFILLISLCRLCVWCVKPLTQATQMFGENKGTSADSSYSSCWSAGDSINKVGETCAFQKYVKCSSAR